MKQTYEKIFGRNIGILNEDDQERLRQTKVAVLGLGGIGGVCFEVLVRSGIGRFSIVDRDTFDISNLNRQNLARHSSLGRLKIDMGEETALEINPEVDVRKFLTINEENATAILEGSHVVVHAIDTLRVCIIASRAARKLGIPLVEGWGLPFGNVRVITPTMPTLESLYGLPTEGRDISSISDEMLRGLEFTLLKNLSAIDGVLAHYQPDLARRAMTGQIPSFAPMIWFTAVMMAIEVIKLRLERGKPAAMTEFTIYDPFEHVQR